MMESLTIREMDLEDPPPPSIDPIDPDGLRNWATEVGFRIGIYSVQILMSLILLIFCISMIVTDNSTTEVYFTLIGTITGFWMVSFFFGKEEFSSSSSSNLFLFHRKNVSD
jgi:xanthine/uracil permease